MRSQILFSSPVLIYTGYLPVLSSLTLSLPMYIAD